MSEEEKEDHNYEDLILNGGVSTWELRMEGNISGTYSGIFKFRCYLTPLQRIAAGKEQRTLLGESRAWVDTPDYEHEAWLAYLITQLKYRIISAPPFWATAGVNKTHEGDIPDENVLEKILDAAVRSELKYRTQLKKSKEGAINRANEGIKAIEEEKKNQEPPEEI